jgi:hypothetical protein
VVVLDGFGDDAGGGGGGGGHEDEEKDFHGGESIVGRDSILSVKTTVWREQIQEL